MERPLYALLADVDGPISNPDAKAIVNPLILPALKSLLSNGIPVVFNTGRSAQFMTQNVIPPLLALAPKNLHLLHAVCEKGAVWLSVEDDGSVSHDLDETIAVPTNLQNRTRDLVKASYSDTMFYDETKETMISVERRPDVDGAAYLATQPPFIADMESMRREAGYTAAELRLDPCVIAVDLESARVGKDLGAAHAFSLLEKTGELPEQWRTIGDSVVDYKMADWLHRNGQTVVHVDVSPQPSFQKREYDVVIPEHGRDDEAGGAYLDKLALEVATA